MNGSRLALALLTFTFLTYGYQHFRQCGSAAPVKGEQAYRICRFAIKG